MRIEADRPFTERVDVELKRAARYRIFVSLIVLDLHFIEGLSTDETCPVLKQIFEVVGANIRAVDQAAVLDHNRLALLLPETPRQGAEIAARRLGELIKSSITEQTQGKPLQMIPTEMASYPDAAGAKTITELLSDFAQANAN